MITWFAHNITNIIVLAIVFALMVLAVVRIVKDRKAGIMACGQKCEHCHGSCANCNACCSAKTHAK